MHNNLLIGIGIYMSWAGMAQFQGKHSANHALAQIMLWRLLKG
jgi:hypothetical protein